VPFIRLKGKWFAKAGFTPTLPIRLRVMGGCIVIALD
jgi:Toxin SymE, type I toxin-antitoxin system